MDLRALAPLLLLAPAAPTSDGDDGPRVPPDVGAVAKPLAQVNWYYRGPDGSVPALADLRGKVVLVHTWGYYCGPCVRKSVPYVADLMETHRANGLFAYSISVPIGDGQPEDHFVKVGREMGMDHPMGIADGYGGMTPYLNMDVSTALTWCFVIGREGGVRWAGDPSSEGEKFLEAVREALLEEPLPPLPEEVPDPLAEAVRAYVAGDLRRAREEAEKVRERRVRKRDEAERAAALDAAAELVQRIDEYRDELLARLESALEARDAREYVAARRSLLGRFPRTDAADRVEELDGVARRDGELHAAVERWVEWDELRRAAPVLFPTRADRDGKRYAKKLRRYVQRAEEGAPGLEEAREMLARFSE